MTLTPEIIGQLAAPFPIAQVEVKPGAVRQDGSAALALAYADWRVYADRLDQIVSPTGWSMQLIPWGTTRIIARLTILGITKDASGEGDPSDAHCGTIAEAQAKKRACAEFGLGRFLYALPRVWGRGQGDNRSFTFDDPQQIVFQLYQQAGLLLARPMGQSNRSPATESHQAAHAIGQMEARNGHPPDPERLATARATLAAAERQMQPRMPTVIDGPAATEKQRNAISALLARCAEHGVNPDLVDQLGATQGVQHLSSVRRAASLPSLTKASASTLIGELDRLLKTAQM